MIYDSLKSSWRLWCHGWEQDTGPCQRSKDTDIGIQSFLQPEDHQCKCIDDSWHRKTQRKWPQWNLTHEDPRRSYHRICIKNRFSKCCYVSVLIHDKWRWTTGTFSERRRWMVAYDLSFLRHPVFRFSVRIVYDTVRQKYSKRVYFTVYLTIRCGKGRRD